MKNPLLKAPFPYFGGKSRVASLIWVRLGDVPNYIEPFCGSAANLLGRPHPPRIETINDVDCMVANFWRATQQDPEGVVDFADSPVNEADLHARHRWLVLSAEAEAFRTKMRTDPDHFDVKIAGWWCWGLCCWIGGGWCTARGRTLEGTVQGRPVLAQSGNGITCKPECEWEQRPRLEGQGVNGLHAKMPDISGHAGGVGRGINIHAASWPGANGPNRRPKLSAHGPGCGVHRKATNMRIQLPDLSGESGASGRGIHRKRPTLGDGGGGGGQKGVISGDRGTCVDRRAWLMAWMFRFRDRLRNTRVCCGNWLRVCDSPSVTTRIGRTGILFDPPYSKQADRDMNLYASECGKVAHAVREYCLERGGDRLMRIALCGYAGEHEDLEKHGWDVMEWQASGGYGNRSAKGKANAARERIWFSPHCLPAKQNNLFTNSFAAESAK